MKVSDIEELLEKYDAGETTLEEEEQLALFFNGEKVPPHLMVYAAQFRFFTAQKGNLAPDLGLDEKLFSHIHAGKGEQKEGGKSVYLNWSLRVAAASCLLLIGFAAGNWYGNNGVSTASKEITPVQREVLALKQTLSPGQEQLLSASDRISAINQVSDIKGVKNNNEELLHLLINTMNFDPNINVRLAACEALFHFRENPAVSVAFMNSLKIQQEPAVQIALIEMLIALEEKRAIDSFRKLLQDDNVLDVVKMRAKRGIGSLS